TPPQVALTAPASDAFLGGRTPQTPVRGTIVEANLSSWTLRFGVGSDPTTWTTIATQTTVPAGDVLKTWDVSAVADGAPALALIAVDKAGNSRETRTRIVVDNTAPTANIGQPANGARISQPVQ